MTGSDPRPTQSEVPPSQGRETSRPPFGFREVVIFTVVVTVFAAILVAVLYLSPLAAR